MCLWTGRGAKDVGIKGNKIYSKPDIVYLDKQSKPISDVGNVCRDIGSQYSSCPMCTPTPPWRRPHKHTRDSEQGGKRAFYHNTSSYSSSSHSYNNSNPSFVSFSSTLLLCVHGDCLSN